MSSSFLVPLTRGLVHEPRAYILKLTLKSKPSLCSRSLQSCPYKPYASMNLLLFAGNTLLSCSVFSASLMYFLSLVNASTGVACLIPSRVGSSCMTASNRLLSFEVSVSKFLSALLIFPILKVVVSKAWHVALEHCQPYLICVAPVSSRPTARWK